MPRAGMGTDFGDYDGDGRLDIFVTNHEFEGHTLFHNLGGGLFEDVTFPSGAGPATLPFVGFGTLFFDYDNDGDLDLSVVNGHVMNSPGHVRPGAKEAQRRVLLRNDGGRFRDVAAAAGAGFAAERVGRALAAGDIDNDGDLDLLAVNNNGPADLLRNGGAPGANAVLVRARRHRQQPQRHRRPRARHDRHRDAAARGEGAARAISPRTICACTSASAPRNRSIGWRSAGRTGSAPEVLDGHRRRPDRHRDRRQGHHRAHALHVDGGRL